MVGNDEMNKLKKKVKKYREIRKRVYEEATKPIQYNEKDYKKNKGLLKNKILDICSIADLDNFKGNGKETIKLLWSLIWKDIFYAGFKAETVTLFININKDYFNDYMVFSNDKWDIEEFSGRKIIKSGNLVDDFLNKKGIFLNKNVIANNLKIYKVVNIARKLKKYVDNPDNKNMMDFVTGGNTDIWDIHDHLKKIGFGKHGRGGDLTALHFMMDIGFPVIKPDVVISKLFLYFGWLHEIIPNLPKDLTYDDIAPPKGYRSKYGRKYVYTNPRMYKPIIDLAREITENIKQKDLKKDIGWVSNNHLREFDLFMVKYGQKPESDFGIETQLFLENTYQNKDCYTK